MKQIHKAGGILIKDLKLLVTRSQDKDFFIAPGGKVEVGESVEQALIRELGEELQITVKIEDLHKFGSYNAIAAGSEDKQLQMDVYIVNSWQGNIAPSAEIEEIKWINSADLTTIKLGSIFEHDVIPELIKQKLID